MRWAPLMLLGLLACSGSSERAPVAPAPRERTKKAPPPPAPSGALALAVTAAGAPLDGVAVWAEEAAEAPKPGAAQLEIGAAGVGPSLLVLPPLSAISVHNRGGAPREIALRAVDAPGDAAPLASRTLPAGGMAGLALPASGMVELVCLDQPCGGARIVVGQAGGVTDAAGKILLRGLPVAPARVHAWHAERGRLDQTIEVKQDAETAAELRYP